MTDKITYGIPTDADWGEMYAVLSAAFNEEADETVGEVERLCFEPERSLVARRDGAIVATAGIHTRRLSIPGGDLPAGHVTLVSVAATARRHGILTHFMNQQFADIRAAGEPVAVLWASEAGIYQRFGYGLAIRRLSLTVDTTQVRLTGAAGPASLREGPLAECRESMAKIYDQAVTRPGWSERASRQWDYRLSDPPAWRRNASLLRAVLHEGDDGVDGYALWRATSDWNDSGPAGEVRVIEHVALNPTAYAALMRFLLTVDLTRTTKFWMAAIDEPLFFMVNEPRRLGARLTDSLWVRLVDLPAALAARRYGAPIDLVLEVRDELIAANAGRWRLTGGPDGAACVSTADNPDLTCDVRILAAAYLAGTGLASLAAAGLIDEHTPGALAQAHSAFGWHQSPSVIEVF